MKEVTRDDIGCKRRFNVHKVHKEVKLLLYIGEKEILESTDYMEIMDAIEEAYAIDLKGAYEMPERIHLERGGNTLLYMPCFLNNSFFGTKFLTLFPGNSEKNLAVINGLYILNDPESGLPLAIIDGSALTAVRTGAVGGVAIRHTTPKDVNSLGLIGAGVQNHYQALFATKTRDFEEIHVFDISADRMKNFSIRLAKQLPGLSIHESPSVEELLDRSKVVITATPSTEPVLPDDRDLLQNRHYFGIGSYKPEMREYPEALYRIVEQIIIDTEHGLEESGDLIIPLQKEWIKQDQIVKFATYIAEGKRFLTEQKTTFFKSVGMALFDLAVAKLIYHNARNKNMGILLS